MAKTNITRPVTVADTKSEPENVDVRRFKNHWVRKIVVGDGSAAPELLRAQVFHRAKVQGTTEFHDYETIGDDEHGEFGFLQEVVLSTGGPSQELLRWSKGFGGEERVEIEINGSLQSDTGALVVSMETRFYEGATEGTTELEDSDVFNTIIPNDQTSNFEINLANDEDDWAKIRGSIANTVLT
ncbi:hypothetical protein [Streptomyces cyaneus]|uniref:hypothetical protein n=1 Tax=Streptomyces cyaneus TaxID=1904 RepID=UPI000FF8AB5D|nr:hypothetical protein [Streptomyces cyaneus]